MERAKFAAGSTLNTDVDKYSVKNITYDANGNILTLGRHNTAAGYIDNLTMTYDGNQLKTADDSGDLALGFYDGTDAEIEYHYDHNGNMDVDDNKGFTFTYNYLNLPKEIVGGNDTVRYIYDASGEKLSKELTQGGAVSYTDYVGNFVYKEGDLDYILTSEGRITEPVSGTIQYEYFLKDHLGNTRTVFADGNGDGVLADNEVLQETHYYPFGMSIGDLAIDRGADNKLKYNGKELQDDMLNGVKLNLYAYGARYYMPDVPVFTTQDPLTEWFSDQSPYLYAYNNPIRFTDFKGMNAKDKVKKEKDPEKKTEKRRFFKKKGKNGEDIVEVLHDDVVYKPDKADRKKRRKYKRLMREVKKYQKNKIKKADRFTSWILRNIDSEALNEILDARYQPDEMDSNTFKYIHDIRKGEENDTEPDGEIKTDSQGRPIVDSIPYIVTEDMCKDRRNGKKYLTRPTINGTYESLEPGDTSHWNYIYKDTTKNSGN